MNEGVGYRGQGHGHNEHNVGSSPPCYYNRDGCGRVQKYVVLNAPYAVSCGRHD